MAREYNRLAPRYDKRWAAFIRATVRETMRRLPLTTRGRLLDVACGTGALLHAVSLAAPETELAGVDLSSEMLDVAAARLGGRADLLVASALELPFEADGFDAVVTTNAFHFFPEPERALTEMRRVLRPGGRLVVTDWCDDFLVCRLCDRVLRLFSPAHFRVYRSTECRALLEDAGFEVIDIARYKISWFWGLMTADARKPV